MAKNRILLADDESTFRETLCKVIEEEGMDVVAVDNGTDAIDAVTKKEFDVAIFDIQMPGADGIKVLRETMKVRPDTRVIMVTAYGTVEMAVEAIKLGASDYVMKPVIFDDILMKIRQQCQYRKLRAENAELKQEIDSKFSIDRIIGESEAMKQVFKTIRKVANTKSSVLITGLSGTGKELVAHAIHSLGTDCSRRFVAVNCSAIPETLLESELFGHKKGSFTSATSDKKGLFEVANGGTLFLDEIGYMSTGCQVKLLRVIEERQILPVGATEPIDIDLRLIAATNKNLQNEIKMGRFREDLYYRVNVVGVHLPTLRERTEDIPELVKHFISKYNKQMGKKCTGVTDEAMRIMMNYEWKGNIRELQNVIERAIIFAEEDQITPSDIGLIGPAPKALDEKFDDLNKALKSYEKEHIAMVLAKYEGNKANTAKALGIGLSSLYRKLDDLKIYDQKQDVV